MFLKKTLVAMIQVAMLASGSGAFAQSTPQDQTPKRTGRGAATATESSGSKAKIEMIKVMHAEIYGIEATLQTVFSGQGATFLAIPEQKTIIFRGSDEILQEVMSLLPQLDVAPTRPQLNVEDLVVLPINYRGVDEITAHLNQMLGNDLGKASGDRARSCVVLRGSAEYIERARMIVKQLDTPAKSVNIEFSFFQADLAPADEKPTIPDDLQPLAAELERFGTIKLLGRLTTNTLEGDSFQVQGMIPNAIEVDISGRVENSMSGEGIRMELRARAYVSPPPSTGGGPGGGNRGAFVLNTNISTKPGEYIVLGTAPAGLADGQSIIMAVHVRP